MGNDGGKEPMSSPRQGFPYASGSISVTPLKILRGQPCQASPQHGYFYLEPPPHLVGCLERQGGIAHENAPAWFG